MDKGNGKDEMPRALVIVGAGASVDYGVPLTSAFGDLIDDAIRSDAYCCSVGGDKAYFYVKRALAESYNDAKEAHFERVYHVLHELSALKLTSGAVPKHLPVMSPFFTQCPQWPDNALKAATSTMIRAIYETVSAACDSPRISLKPLTEFFERIEQEWIPRVYTTNYDDFIAQATNNRYQTGYSISMENHNFFDSQQFWSRWNEPSLFHLHGSIHMGFPKPGERIGDIGWFPDRADALRNFSFTGSGTSRMDGTSIDRSAIITGLDKLGRLQQTPYAYYYSSLSRDAMEADIVFVLGSGLADLHLNTWLNQARRAKPDLPVIYVGWWPGDAGELFAAFNFDFADLEIHLLHELGIDISRLPETAYKATDGWTINDERACALWADGFDAFLSKPEALELVLNRIRTRSS